jgi:hypothetical protein
MPEPRAPRSSFSLYKIHKISPPEIEPLGSEWSCLCRIDGFAKNRADDDDGRRASGIGGLGHWNARRVKLLIVVASWRVSRSRQAWPAG